MIKAVIFDLDNTLVDFMAMKRQAINAAICGMIDAGIELSSEEVRTHIDKIYNEQGIEYQLVFDHLLKEVLGRVDYKILSAGIIAYRRAREAALTPYPHVTATLMRLVKNGIRLAVVSDAPAREAWLRLCQMNFHHIFDVVVTFDDTGERKPGPKPFMMALNKLGDCMPEEVLMIGDWAERDMVGAKNVGMQTAFAGYGDSFGNQQVEADYILSDITDVLKIIEDQNGIRLVQA